MNHFEFGFFDELEKIATNKAEVADWRKYIINAHPELKGAPRGYIGGHANRMAQRSLGTTGQLEGRLNDPRFNNEPGFRFKVSVPDPKVPGGRLVANGAQRNKFLDRIDSTNLSSTRVFLDNLTAPKRAKLGVWPYGLQEG